MKQEEREQFFTTQLMEWYDPDARPMPWKEIKDPYKIWLSEIILQQTRVAQGWAYFERFVLAFPSVSHLAEAETDEVMKLWEGLGYYSRARNLHFSAKKIMEEFGGEFPNNYKDILSLKGVGPYTAAAIASFAFDLPYAVLDGNVFRVLSRFFNVSTAIDGTEGKKLFTSLAQKVLDISDPAKYNQTIMDFGATQCKPANPDCNSCPMQDHCEAFAQNTIQLLPVKTKKLKKRTRYFNFVVLMQGEDTWIERREGKDIWKQLHQFPCLESEELYTKKEIQSQLENHFTEVVKGKIIQESKPYQQLLTHQKIIAKFWKIEVENFFVEKDVGLMRIEYQNLSNFAFPKIIDCYLKDKSLYLSLFEN